MTNGIKQWWYDAKMMTNDDEWMLKTCKIHTYQRDINWAWWPISKLGLLVMTIYSHVITLTHTRLSPPTVIHQRHKSLLFWDLHGTSIPLDPVCVSVDTSRDTTFGVFHNLGLFEFIFALQLIRYIYNLMI